MPCMDATPNAVILIGGPADGRRLSVATHPEPDYLCTRAGSGPWHHYERGEFNSYWYAGPCAHSDPAAA